METNLMLSLNNKPNSTHTVLFCTCRVMFTGWFRRKGQYFGRWQCWLLWRKQFICTLDIWLAVHHSKTFLLLPTWYTNFLFTHTNYIKL